MTYDPTADVNNTWDRRPKSPRSGDPTKPNPYNPLMHPPRIPFWDAAAQGERVAEAIREGEAERASGAPFTHLDDVAPQRETATGPGMTNLEAELVALRAEVERHKRFNGSLVGRLMAMTDRAEATETERDEAWEQVSRVRSAIANANTVMGVAMIDVATIARALDGA